MARRERVRQAAVRAAAVRWTDLHDTISAGHPELVAVHQAPRGQLALLLSHALAPVNGQRRAWRRQTRRAALVIARDLRAAGLRRPLLIVQWLPPAHASRVLDGWRLLWQGNPLRASHLRAAARLRAADARFLALRAAERRRGHRARRKSIEQWYTDLAPLWLGLGPAVRRQLVLQTHLWITERMMTSAGASDSDEAEYQALTHRLQRLVPPDDRDLWAGWIDTVVATLLRAFDRPPALRDARWTRALFLAACRVPPPLADDALLRAL
jgi:hypothetical protein